MLGEKQKILQVKLNHVKPLMQEGRKQTIRQEQKRSKRSRIDRNNEKGSYYSSRSKEDTGIGKARGDGPDPEMDL